MGKTLTVRLTKSAVCGVKRDQTATCRALGLRKINDTVEQPDNASIRGMLFQVKHLVSVQGN